MQRSISKRKRIKIVDVLEEYYQSLDFRKLGNRTQYDYKYCLKTLLDTTVDRANIGLMYFGTLTTPRAQKAYDQWAERGTSFANHTQAVASKFYNYAIQRGYAETNPFRNLSKKPYKPRKVVWTREDISLFLSTAYSEFKWRSVGLIVHMAFEWCQRLGDMRTLKWDNLDLDSGVLYLEQSKRRSKVELPISEDLRQMLIQQKADVGRQPYVAPMCTQKAYHAKPYGKMELSQRARDVMRAAGMSPDLQIMDMRRTGTTEMVDAGVPLTNIMMVTGHASPASLKPYIKNTLTGAKVALTARQNHDSLLPRRTGGEVIPTGVPLT
jgi:integrase